MSGRGMKKWAPFQSLNEQASYLSVMRERESKVERPRISSDVAEEINEILVNYHNQDLKIKLYDDGHIYDIIAPIKKIDVMNRCIYIDDNKVNFVDIINLENI